MCYTSNTFLKPENTSEKSPIFYSYLECVFSKIPISIKVWLILLHVLSELKLYPRSYKCWKVNEIVTRGSQNWKQPKPHEKGQEKIKKTK